jgi:light-regulated signal transduction histidine kinase (bacteriophytochrome)
MMMIQRKTNYREDHAQMPNPFYAGARIFNKGESMTEEKQTLAIDGAQFFGEMTASISHEIKNVMAIINENAGLLEDMVAMNRKGAPFPVDRMEKLAQSVTRQIARADEIIQTMNRFAHSADRTRETVDVGETVQFMMKLTSRLTMMQGARFDFSTPEKPVTTAANRFFLAYLVWRGMAAAMEMSQADESIRMRVETTENGPCMAFSGVGRNDAFSAGSLSALEDSDVLRLLDARLVLHPEKGEFRVFFSKEYD